MTTQDMREKKAAREAVQADRALVISTIEAMMPRELNKTTILIQDVIAAIRNLPLPKEPR